MVLHGDPVVERVHLIVDLGRPPVRLLQIGHRLRVVLIQLLELLVYEHNLVLDLVGEFGLHLGLGRAHVEQVLLRVVGDFAHTWPQALQVVPVINQKNNK